MAPHGFCFMWLPEILWLHIVADSLIALSYFSIPLALWRFAHKRPDMPFNKIFILFATFITLCGLTHVFGILVMWKPYYGPEGLLMLATGLVSATTAILVWKILPSALTLPSPSELSDMNRKLSQSYEETENQVRERTAELERANAELTIARLKADEASQAKTEFLANISHEIRTPMNVVVGLTQILAESTPLTEKQRQYLSTLKTSADSMLSLIEDLLDIGRIESNTQKIDRVPFNLYQRLQEIMAIMEVRATAKGLDFKLNVIDNAIRQREYYGDPNRFRQIILNLCVNAIKFTDRGGVMVTVSRETNAATDDTETVIIGVADTGIGILPEKKDVIFEKFVQADNSITRKYGGTGIGLSIARMYLEQMGGTILLESEIGRGTVFTLRLPLSVAPGLAGKTELPAFPSKPVLKAAGRKILLVEDYEPNVLVATVMLDRFGFSYDVASNGDDAVQKYVIGNYDLILMDIQMPVKNGWDATVEIRKYEAVSKRKHTPIIGMTAHAYKEDFDRCQRAGMDDCLVKPYTAEDLEDKILSCLTRED